MTPYFSKHELSCRHCGQAKFHPGFLTALDGLRIAFGRPMNVTSGARCRVHNGNVGGHPKSLHIFDEPQHPGQDGALALDVATLEGAYRAALFSLAWQHGFSIGWNGPRKFLHLDRRDLVGLPQTSFDY